MAADGSAGMQVDRSEINQRKEAHSDTGGGLVAATGKRTRLCIASNSRDAMHNRRNEEGCGMTVVVCEMR